MEKAKYNRIYEYYLCRIMFGYFDQGSYLPTIEQIGDIFQMAPRTVRNALSKLEERGLVSISSGKRINVAYSASRDEKFRFTKEYYLARKDAILEINRMGHLLLMPLLHEGVRRLSDEDLSRIGHGAEQKDADVTSLSLLCCDVMLGALGNQLINDLYFEMISFHQFPWFPSMKLDEGSYRESYQLFLSGCRQLDREKIFQAFVGFQKVSQKILQDFIHQAAKELPIPEQIPFHWQTYRERPQHCHSLAADLIWQISSGRYPEGSFFPSYENLAKEFSVSVSTVRRSTELLRNMGVVTSINGVGSKVTFSKPDWEKLRRPSMRKIIQMAIQSIEALSLTIGSVIPEIFQQLTDDQIAAAKAAIQGQQRSHGLCLIFVCMSCLKGCFPIQLVDEVYEKLFEFILIVYPLLITEIKDDGPAFSRYLLPGLEAKDPSLFLKSFQEALQMANLMAKNTEKMLQEP